MCQQQALAQAHHRPAVLGMRAQIDLGPRALPLRDILFALIGERGGERLQEVS